MEEFGRSIVTRQPEPVERGKIYEYDQDSGDLILAMRGRTVKSGVCARSAV